MLLFSYYHLVWLVLIEIIANTLYPFYFLTIQITLSTNISNQASLSMDIDVDMNTFRDRPLFSSNNNSRESSILSTTSSIPYCK